MAKKKGEFAFKTNPEKANYRVNINSRMMGILFVILTLAWTLKFQEFNITMLAQLVLAIPLLFVSTLSYAKIGYWKETKLWDTFGWFTHNLGTLFVLNVLGLITALFNKNLAFLYFGLTISLMAIYSAINCIYKPYELKVKMFKFSFLVGILFVGGILPLLI